MFEKAVIFLINNAAVWINLDDEQLSILNGGGLLDTLCGITCIVVGGAAIVGAIVATVYCPTAITETGKLAAAGVAAVVSGAKILGH